MSQDMLRYRYLANNLTVPKALEDHGHPEPYTGSLDVVYPGFTVVDFIENLCDLATTTNDTFVK